MRLRSIHLKGMKFFPGAVSLTGVGKITTLVGPNSAGKTTLLKAIFEVLDVLRKMPMCMSRKPQWYSCTQARIAFELSDGCDPPPSIEMPSCAQVTLTVAAENDEWCITTIECDSQQYSLIENRHPKRGLPTGEEKKLEALTTKPNPTASEKNILADLMQRRDALDTSVFVYKSSTREVNTRIKKAEWQTWIKSMLPQPKLIEARQDPHDSVQKLLNEALESRRGRDQSRCKQIEKELADLLESDVVIYEENGEEHISVNNVDYRELSSGTQTCLYFHCLLNEYSERSIILWDEPENGLHATRRFKLKNLMHSDSRQFILGTHAPQMTSVIDEGETYRLCRQKTDGKYTTSLVEHVTNRRQAFEVLEGLGVEPARTVFTANVVIWVEGPSDILFWRKLLNKEDLIEGFHYTFAMYGGRNIDHIDIDNEKPLPPNIGLRTLVEADILSLCRYPAIITDSDRRSVDASLKEGVARVQEKVVELNRGSIEMGFFLATPGREIENYLPKISLQHAVRRMVDNWTQDEKTKIEMTFPDVPQYSSVAGELREWLIRESIVWDKGPHKGKPKYTSKIGGESKVDFMRAALSSPDFGKHQLLWDGAKDVDRLTTWIRAHQL